MSMLYRISIKFTLLLGLSLTLLLGAGLYLIDLQGQSLLRQDEVERAKSTAEIAIGSLKSIMLAGYGDTAHAWLQRVAAQPSIDFAKIYRPDGVEAFNDLETVQMVNRFLSVQRFSRHEITGSGRIDPSLKAAFDKVVNKNRQTEVRSYGRMTILYPIRAEQACQACHGYTDNMLQGVLVLGVPTVAATTRLEKLLSRVTLGFLVIILLFVTVVAACLRKFIIKPLLTLNTAAKTISGGDLGYRIRSERKDEFGTVAHAFDHLVEHLEGKIETESKQKKRQQLLTDAVISLSRQTVKKDILYHVGELAMEMVKARYAMVVYTDARGKRHLVPLGISEQQIAAIARIPKGEGLLKLFLNSLKAVRVNNIMSHPDSVGFPEGNTSMHSLLGVPIIFSGEVLGAIYLTDRSDNCDFSEDDEHAITLLASACAIALSNLRNAQSELAVVNQHLQTREIELELINEELTQANEAKSQFLTNTSHELRTPLNAIIGFSELLRDPRMGLLSDKQNRYVNHVHASGKRLLTIINDLLDISKIEAGMMMIDETPCHPGQIAREVIHGLAPLADGKHITLQLEDVCPDDEKVTLDGGKLHQIMVNLIGNAIKFTSDQGRVTIHVSIEKVNPNKCFVRVVVSDTGCGIADEDQKKIFEPFVQVSGGLNREHGGTGLGLALTRRQVNLLGGSIKLQSESGYGSKFTIELPAEPTYAVQEHRLPQIDSAVSETVPKSGPRPKILVVDADDRRTEAVIELMEVQGYEAFRSDISNAAERCDTLCVYLIILGIPSGDELLHQNLQLLKTHKATRNLPVLLVGGDADELEFSTGPVGVVEKGIKQQDLLDMISRYCRYIPAHPEVPAVLVIDDEPSVREFLRDTLVAEGFRVLLASNGWEGVQAAVEREPDMIILDLMMPQVSGFDVIRQLHRHPVAAHIPILIYTAKDLSREEALHLGREAERVLIKGSSGRAELVRQLQKMELLYPARAHLIDPVLDCFNMRYMDRRLDQEISNAKRHALRFSLVCWKIDHYTPYTERHGERWGIAAL
ncbi:MAG TPA: response regulator, partial [Gammaproteobacteria bacterium]|nr:response regulator [Gammaproteobacteria bacterium]